jgi:hypothetical protein
MKGKNSKRKVRRRNWEYEMRSQSDLCAGKEKLIYIGKGQ